MIQKKVSITLDQGGIKAKKLIKAFAKLYGLTISESLTILVSAGIDSIVEEDNGENVHDDFKRYIDANHPRPATIDSKTGISKYVKVSGSNLYDLKRFGGSPLNFWVDL